MHLVNHKCFVAAKKRREFKFFMGSSQCMMVSGIKKKTTTNRVRAMVLFKVPYFNFHLLQLLI